MHLFLFPTFLALLCVSTAVAQVPFPDSLHTWHSLVEKKQFDEAEALCTQWLDAEPQAYRTEAHKCLANLVLADASMIRLERSEHGGTIRDGFHPEAADSAAEHLSLALSLTPADLSVHKGRLAVLVRAGFYARADSALAESLRIMSDSTDVNIWLPYGAQMYYADLYEEALAYMKVLERFYPNDHRVVANIGAMLTLLERDGEALPYARRAVELNPEDPTNNWNLGRLYMYTSKPQEAETYYRRALELNPDGQVDGRPMWCSYADFVEEHLGETERADSIRQEHCMHEK